MVGIILASHGQFAAGIKQSGEMIFGQQNQVEVVTFMPEEGPNDLHQHLMAAIAKLDPNAPVLFLVDLWGGSPFNQANAIYEKHQDEWAIVTGLNLPMLIEAYGLRLSMNSAQEIAAKLVQAGRQGVKIKPEKLDQTAPFTSTPKAAPTTPANVGKKGKMKYVLARIDSRLLHGQVATSWTKTTGANRIIVVSDLVAKDKLRKGLIKDAAPVGVKAHVVPIAQMIKLAQDDQHFGDTRALLLFENPEDAQKAIAGGVPLTEINVGSMAHSAGKAQPNKVLAFDEKDIASFKAMEAAGVKFDVRKVPNDSPENLDAILDKAERILQNAKA